MHLRQSWATFVSILTVALTGCVGCSAQSGGGPREPGDVPSGGSQTGSTVVIAPVAAVASPQGGVDPETSEERAAHDSLDGCRIVDTIEDGENDDNQIIVHNGRSGYIYTFADAEGTAVLPLPGALGGVFTTALEGAAGSTRALRIQGKLASAHIIFAGLGLNFLDPKDQFDASAYDGVTFYAKAHGDAARVRFGLTDVNTEPDGGQCSSCYNLFGANLELLPRWTRYTLRFSALQQAPGWGNPRPPHVSSSRLYGALWQVTDPPGGSYDVWIDDFAFISCR